MRALVAAGLILFGFLSPVEARFGCIHRPPPLDRVAVKVAEKVRS